MSQRSGCGSQVVFADCRRTLAPKRALSADRLCPLLALVDAFAVL